MNDVDEDEIGGPWVVQANDGSFTAFFNRMYVPLVSFASWWGHSHHDADEAVGTVMADMCRRWDGIRRMASGDVPPRPPGRSVSVSTTSARSGSTNPASSAPRTTGPPVSRTRTGPSDWSAPAPSW